MQKFKESVLQANKYLKNADHLLNMTYPLIKDVKLLVSILDNLDKSLQYALYSFLYYDYVYKKIISIPSSFSDKFDLFKRKSAIKYNINLDTIKLIREVHETMQIHKKSPVEFERNNKFVICSSTYRMRTISIEEIKKYITETKLFIQEANNIVSRNERIFT